MTIAFSAGGRRAATCKPLNPPQEIPHIPGLRSQTLFSDRFCCVLRADHPAVEDGGLSLERFCELEHLLISPHGKPGSPVDTTLEGLGLKRKVRVETSSFVVPAWAVAESDRVVTMPRRIARMLQRTLPIVLVEPPLEVRGFRMMQVWHERWQHDPAHRWLRRSVYEVCRSLPDSD